MNVTRRQAIGGVAVTALTVTAALLRTQAGYRVPPGGAVRAALSLADYCIVHALAARICGADEDGVILPEQVGVAAFVDGFVAAIDAPQRTDLQRLLQFIEHLAPLAQGRRSRFTLLSAGQQDAVLAALETHPVELIRGGFQCLKGLVFMGFYRDPRTWGLLHYEGPWVGRPQGGFAIDAPAGMAAP
jgi:Gluconate 2-dehydrogenase subunit 3